MTEEAAQALAALRDRLTEFDDEIRDFDRTLRADVAAFRKAFEAERKDFSDHLEERERTFFLALEGRIAHWRANQRAILVLLDAELVQLSVKPVKPAKKT